MRLHSRWFLPLAAGAGDVNGDGVPDLIVGAHQPITAPPAESSDTTNSIRTLAEAPGLT